jgi:cation diffusion facilitator CzcD-associated flavoprotein CzcO
MVPSTTPVLKPQRICIVGAGAAGLAVLKAIVDTPQHKAGVWVPSAFEAREEIGGVW